MKKRLWFAVLGLVLSGCKSTPHLTIDELLRQTSNDLNKTTPYMVDSETRLDSTYTTPNKFSYKYTLVSYALENLDAEKFHDMMKTQVTSFVCTTPDMTFFVQNQVNIGFSYYDKTSKFVTEVVVLTAECPTPA